MDAKLEAFRDLCRKASTEADPAELESLKDALRFMVRSEEIELGHAERNPAQNQINGRAVLCLTDLLNPM